MQEARKKSTAGKANEYWMKLSSSVQEASNTRNATGMYEGIKQATGKNVRKIAPVKNKRDYHKWEEANGKVGGTLPGVVFN